MGRAFDYVDIGQPERRQPFHGAAEQGLRIAVVGVIGRAHRRQSQTCAVPADLARHRLRHLIQKARAVFDAAAVFILAPVAGVLEKLIDQVAVGTVDLHAVESGVHGVARGAAIVLDDRGNLVEAQRPGLGDVSESAFDEGLGVGTDRGRRHRHLALGQQAQVRDAAHVPQLEHHASAGGMHCVRDLAPAGDLLRRMNSRRAQIALAQGTDLGRFADDQAGAGALRIVGGMQVGGNIAVRGAVARQRRHRDAVGEPQGTD